MSKTSHPIDDLELMAYLDGELPRERAAATAAHLQHCRECQTICGDLRGVSQEMAAWLVESTDLEIPTRVATTLEKYIGRQQSAPKRRRSWRLLSVRWVWAVGLAVAALVILVFSNLGTFRLENPHTFSAMHTYTGPTAPSEDKAENGPRAAADYASDLNGSMPVVGESLRSKGTLGGTLGKLEREKRQIGGGSHREVAIPTGPMVIRTAELTLIAKDFAQARSGMEDILKRHNGYLGQLTVTGSADAARTLSATLRVPFDQLDATLAELKKLGRVESESQKGDEVSQQYVDLQARLMNARNTEQRLTDILRQRTGKLSDVLAVEQEIASVREEIERMEAAKKNLEKHVAFSTLNVKVAEDYKQQVHVVPESTSTRIRNAAVDGYETLIAGLINVLLFLVSIGPSLLVWGAIFFFPARVLWKKWQKRNII